MSSTSTEGPNTASTGTVQNPEYNKQYPPYKHPNLLEYSEYQECWTLRFSECSQHILSKCCQYSKYSSSPPNVICFNAHSWNHPWTVNAVCNKMRMKLSKRRFTDRYLILPSILRIFQVFWYYSENSQYSQYQYSQYNRKKYCRYSKYSNSPPPKQFPSIPIRVTIRQQWMLSA